MDAIEQATKWAQEVNPPITVDQLFQVIGLWESGRPRDVASEPPRIDTGRIHAVAFNTVGPAVVAYNDERGYEGERRHFVPLSLRRAISEAVVKAIAAETGLPLAPAEGAS